MPYAAKCKLIVIKVYLFYGNYICIWYQTFIFIAPPKIFEFTKYCFNVHEKHCVSGISTSGNMILIFIRYPKFHTSFSSSSKSLCLAISEFFRRDGLYFSLFYNLQRVFWGEGLVYFRTGPFLTWLDAELFNSGSTMWYWNVLNCYVSCRPVCTKLKWSI
jgi:hypothetical protein